MSNGELATTNARHARSILLLAHGRNNPQAKGKRASQPLNMPGGGPRGARIPVKPVGGAPLQSGAVEDTFTEGPKNYAIERYQLNGALPNTTFDIRLVITIGKDDCSGPEIIQPSVQLTTNNHGNGQASVRVPPEFLPPIAFDKVNSLHWQFVANGVVYYDTECTAIFEDIP